MDEQGVRREGTTLAYRLIGRNMGLVWGHSQFICGLLTGKTISTSRGVWTLRGLPGSGSESKTGYSYTSSGPSVKPEN